MNISKTKTQDFSTVHVDTRQNNVGAWLLLSLHIVTYVISPFAAANSALKSSALSLIPYVVVSGDTLYTISARYGLTIDELRQLNKAAPSALVGDRINVGQTIYVPAFSKTNLPELGNQQVISDNQPSSPNIEGFIARQAVRLGSTYGASDSSGRALNDGNIKKDSSDAASKKTLTTQSPSFIEKESEYFKKELKSAFETEANEYANAYTNKFVDGFGKANVKLGFDEKAQINQYAFDLLTPVLDDPNRLIFLQTGVRYDEASNRTIINVGAGDRHFGEEWMVGYNAFFDHDITRSHSRIGLGGETWADYLKLSTNFYLPVTSWKDSPDVARYQERPARGMDANAIYYVPQYPQIGINFKAEQYWGKEVALLSKSKRDANPYAGTLGLSWTPIPLLKVGVDQRHAKGGQHDTNLNLGLEWKLGATLTQMLDPNHVAASRQLQGMRHDMVERNNNIVLEYREKENHVSIEHEPAVITGMSGAQFTLNPVVTMSYGRVANWRWSSPDPLLQGAISDTSLRNPILTLPALPQDAVVDQVFTLNLSITDDAGRNYQATPIKVTVKVNPEQILHRLVIISGAGFADSIDSPDSEAQVGDQGLDIEFVLIQEVQTDASAGRVVPAEQMVVVEQPTGYQVEHLGGEYQTLSADSQNIWVNKLRVTPQAQARRGGGSQVLSFHAKDAENLSSGKVNITLVKAETQPTGQPSVIDLRLAGKLEVGSSLLATYRFAANGGQPDDQSRYQWGNRGQTAALVENGATVIRSGEVPAITLTLGDVGEVKELSLQARNADGVTGNTLTVDSNSLGGAVTDKARHVARVHYSSSATMKENGIAGVRPVAQVDQMTAYCKADNDVDFYPCGGSYTYRWFVRDEQGDEQLVAGETASTYLPRSEDQGKQILVEVTPI